MSNESRPGRVFSRRVGSVLWTWSMWTARPPAVLRRLGQWGHRKCFAFWWDSRILSSSNSRSQYQQKEPLASFFAFFAAFFFCALLISPGAFAASAAAAFPPFADFGGSWWVGAPTPTPAEVVGARAWREAELGSGPPFMRAAAVARDIVGCCAGGSPC